MVRKLLSSLALGVLLMSIASSVNAAGCASCDAGCCTAGCESGCNDGCGVCCPNCDCVCKLKAEMVDVDKHCWKVECKKICVPKFVFPWQKSCCDPCANNGAWTREVNVLKKHKYTCPECEYSWSPKDATCDSDKCCGGCTSGCDSCCAGTVVDETTTETPTPAADADSSIDIPPAPPAPSALNRPALRLRAASTKSDARAKSRTSALQTALKKLRK